jgi:phosphatidylglycerol:prolipoprotein diacylglycerol transferase
MTSFWIWWQHLPEHIDPVIFQIGSFRLQYYGLMYLVAFGTTYLLAKYRLKTEDRWQFNIDHLQGLITAIIIGLIIGARLGYVLFYNLGYYAAHPLEIILPFEFGHGIRFTGISGMSYHGGLIGSLIGLYWYSRKYKLGVRNSADLLAPCGALGYTFGRLGNFINGELWGRITTAPFGMHFPHARGEALRHPSQLYEAFGEGIVLFLVLWTLRRRLRTPGATLAVYLIGYGTARFIVEFFREPDSHLGFVFLFFSMGQILCSLMILAGLGLFMGCRYWDGRAAGHNAKK